MSKSKRVVLGVTGSIAAYKACDIARAVLEKGHNVSIIMTRDAERFITPLTLSALIGEQVHRSFWDETDPSKMPHITLAKEADAFLVAPATANIIGKLAHGLADDLLSCAILGTKAPVFVAPAMNSQMYLNKIVQANCAVLKKNGFKFVEPVKAKLACGDYGVGHLADVADIVKAVMRSLK